MHSLVARCVRVSDACRHSSEVECVKEGLEVSER